MSGIRYLGGNKTLEVFPSVVAAGSGGSVRLPLSLKDGIAAPAGGGEGSMLREGTVATLKRND